MKLVKEGSLLLHVVSLSSWRFFFDFSQVSVAGEEKWVHDPFKIEFSHIIHLALSELLNSVSQRTFQRTDHWLCMGIRKCAGSVPGYSKFIFAGVQYASCERKI